MSEGKRYYWLKLKEDFFGSKRIKKLRNMAGGDTYLIIYLKMQLKAMKTEGIIRYDHLEDNIAAELALDLDERTEDVAATLIYLTHCGLAEVSDSDQLFLPYAVENVGSEKSSAARVRECRAKTNAERQKAFRARQTCEKRHIPLIEDSQNSKRYNGNYYLVMQRDRYQCTMCGSTENLCVHHIDGYDENDAGSSEMWKMIVLCRSCHSKVHRAGLPVPQDILDAIGYERNESNVTGNVTDNVTCNGEKESEINSDKRENTSYSCSDLPSGDSEPAVYKLILNDKTYFDVTESMLAKYRELYPAVDIDQEMRKMIGWCDGNPVKRKTRRGIKAFIANWLSKQQDRGPKMSKTDIFDNV